MDGVFSKNVNSIIIVFSFPLGVCYFGAKIIYFDIINRFYKKEGGVSKKKKINKN